MIRDVSDYPDFLHLDECYIASGRVITRLISSYAAHLHLNDRANEKSTAHPATSLSGHLDRTCSALLFSQAGHFANAQ
jgi:hypothetical protein